MKEHSSRLLWVISFVSWYIFTLILSSLPSSSFPDSKLFSFDKVAHMFEYVVTSVLFLKTLDFYGKKLSKIPIWLILVLFIYPVLDELHQLFIPGRSCSFFDMIADWLGITVGLLIYLWLSKRHTNEEA